MTQDSIVGVALPAPLGSLYRDLMSPYCPGLSLASCPSPQADSLRDVIAERYGRGETPEAITTSLVADFGPGIRGSPTLDGFGSVAFVVPALLFVVGGVLIARWLRRNRERPRRDNGVAALLVLVLGSAFTQGCSDADSALATASAPWVSDAWVRAGSADMVLGGYATVHNPSDSAIEVIGAGAPEAEAVDIHETVEHEGMVHMEARPSLAVPPRDSVRMAPGGLHFMIRGLRRGIAAGDSLELYLLLANGDTIPVRAGVRAPGVR